MIMLLAGVLVSAAVSPKAECSQFVQSLTSSAARTESERISRLSQVKTSASEVHLMMALGGWRLVWATPVGSEEGIWFLRDRPSGEKLVDVWGGSFSDDADRAGGVAWAKAKGVPLPLARCFAAIGIDHEMMR